MEFADPLENQLAVLGDSVDHNSRFVLDINAESLELMISGFEY